MNIRIFALMILALLTISSAHAESYTFTDSTSFTTVDYVSGSHNPAPVTTRTQSISGTTGVIPDLNVSLNGIYSGGLMDMTYVLVGPNNTGVVLTSNAGNFSGGISSYTLSMLMLLLRLMTKQPVKYGMRNRLLWYGTMLILQEFTRHLHI